MKKSSIVAGGILIALLGLAAARQASAASADEAAIKALEERLAKAVNAKDLDGVMACYISDESLFVFDLIPPRQYVGAKAYRENWKGFLTGPGTIRVEISDLSVTVAGDTAYAHLIHHFNGIVNDKPLDLTDRVTDIYRKLNGQWVIVQEHISIPVDLETGRGDLTSKP